MNAHNESLARALSGLALRIETAEFAAKGFHACVVLEHSGVLPKLAEILYQQGYFMGFVTACHTTPVIQALYQFALFDANHRIMVRCPADSDNSVPSISHIFQGADWHERETRDFFGLNFTGHPNLIPLILDESDRDLKPLLKKDGVLKSVDDIFVQEVSHE